jgi:hypothetical protein
MPAMIPVNISVENVRAAVGLAAGIAAPDAGGAGRVAWATLGDQHATELARWPGAIGKPGPRGQDRAPMPAPGAGEGTGLLIGVTALRERKHPYLRATGIRPQRPPVPWREPRRRSGCGRRRDRGCRITPGGPGSSTCMPHRAGRCRPSTAAGRLWKSLWRHLPGHTGRHDSSGGLHRPVSGHHRPAARSPYSRRDRRVRRVRA